MSTALLPAAAAYGYVARRRQAGVVPFKASVPVICIGNVVTGGSGKTPVALAVGALLKARGINAHYLSRGYKGKLKGPVRVDAQLHTAGDVGDEPLLLSAVLPTWVSRDRVAGAQAAMAAGAGMILMDDGFQNPSLMKDVSLLVIDGAYGYGNGLLLPAGPLREPVAQALARASAVVLMGNDGHGVLIDLPKDVPVLRGELKPLEAARRLAGTPVLAFAGIARPRKFYRTLQDIGCDVRKMVAYPDHYAFKAHDLAFLKATAKQLQSTLVTTEKDYVRLPADIRAEVACVPVVARFEDTDALLKIVLRSQR